MADPEVKRVAARADLCRLLAACYYQPGPEFSEEKVFDAMSVAAAQVHPSLVSPAESVMSAFSSGPLETLQVDYTALFMNPGGALASPYQSAWIAGKDPMLAEQAIETVTSFYADAGFKVDQEFRDLPDHIAAELEFLYALIFREARARANGDEADRKTAIDLQRRFLTGHLGRWIAQFCGAMRSHAQTGFYRSLAALTQRFVKLESAESSRNTQPPPRFT